MLMSGLEQSVQMINLLYAVCIWPEIKWKVIMTATAWPVLLP